MESFLSNIFAQPTSLQYGKYKNLFTRITYRRYRDTYIFHGGYKLKFIFPPRNTYLSISQTTQTAYLFSQGGLRRPIVDPAGHATILRL